MGMFINPRTAGSANLVLHLDSTSFYSANSAVNSNRWENLANNIIGGLDQSFFTGCSISGTNDPAPYLDHVGNFGNTKSYFVFNGQNQNAGQLGRSNQRAMQTDFTLEILCNFHTAFLTDNPIMEKINASNNGWALRANNTINGGNPGFEFATFNSGTKKSLWSTSRDIEIDNWYFVQATASFAASNPLIHLYVNGRLEAAGVLGQAVNDTTPAYLNIAALGGEGSPPGAPHSNVAINMVRVYTKALSNTEIYQNWQAMSPRLGANTIISWY